MKNKLLPINLQFFAEGDEPDVEIDDGGNDPVDNAEPEGWRKRTGCRRPGR